MNSLRVIPFFFIAWRDIKAEQPSCKLLGQALAGVVQWIERGPVNQGVAGSIPSQGTWPGPQ